MNKILDKLEKDKTLNKPVEIENYASLIDQVRDESILMLEKKKNWFVTKTDELAEN
jgi:hypothetical protein